MKIKLYILSVLLFLCCPALSPADPIRMSIQPNGKGSFFLTGENVLGVQAMDIEIDYDSSMLTSPYVLINGGEIAQLHADTPGKLFLSIFRRVADPVLQVIVNFEAQADETRGGIHHISANATSTTKWPADADQPSTVAGSEDASADESSSASSPTDTGVAALTVDPAPAPDRSRGGETPSAATGSVSPAGIDKKVRTQELIILTRDEKSVLQRFKKFKGEAGLNSFAALFERGEGDTTLQEPPIALSDGKTPVTIRMDLRPGEGPQITFALSDARLITKEVSEKGLLITVLPNEGTWDARLVVLAGQTMIDYPLVVAPSAKLEGGVTADNFISALHAYISGQSAALHPRNKTYLAEYIFTANYLAIMSNKTR